MRHARQIDKCRRDLLTFTEHVTEDYMTGWIHRVIAEKMQALSEAIARGESPRIILQVPPRFGKSCLAERLAAWHLGRNPGHSVIITGYALEPAKDRTRAARKVVVGDEFKEVFPDLAISADTRAKANWETTEGGGCYAAGIGGATPVWLSWSWTWPRWWVWWLNRCSQQRWSGVSMSLGWVIVR